MLLLLLLLVFLLLLVLPVSFIFFTNIVTVFVAISDSILGAALAYCRRRPSCGCPCRLFCLRHRRCPCLLGACRGRFRLAEPLFQAVCRLAQALVLRLEGCDLALRAVQLLEGVLGLHTTSVSVPLSGLQPQPELVGLRLGGGQGLCRCLRRPVSIGKLGPLGPHLFQGPGHLRVLLVEGLELRGQLRRRVPRLLLLPGLGRRQVLTRRPQLLRLRPALFALGHSRRQPGLGPLQLDVQLAQGALVLRLGLHAAALAVRGGPREGRELGLLFRPHLMHCPLGADAGLGCGGRPRFRGLHLLPGRAQLDRERVRAAAGGPGVVQLLLHFLLRLAPAAPHELEFLPGSCQVLREAVPEPRRRCRHDLRQPLAHLVATPVPLDQNRRAVPAEVPAPTGHPQRLCSGGPRTPLRLHEDRCALRQDLVPLLQQAIGCCSRLLGAEAGLDGHRCLGCLGHGRGQAKRKRGSRPAVPPSFRQRFQIFVQLKM